MYNPQSILLSPMNKRRDIDEEEEANHLMIRSSSNNNGMIYNSNKKKVRYDHAANWTIDNLCTHPYSPLATIDLESVFNVSNFQLLSQEKREELCQLLPDIDYSTHSPLDHSIDPYVAPSFFSKAENPSFWNALYEWQEILSTGQFMEQFDSPTFPLSPSPPSTISCKSSIKLKSKSKPKSKVASTKKDKFKEEPFESYYVESIDKEKVNNVAGDSKTITLKDMCRKGLIREHDVIIYKRNFSACKVIVSKSMTVIKASGLSGISINLDGELFEDFETPTALETKILDHHGKVTKDKRPNGNAFKSIRLIRNGHDMGRLFDIRKDGFSDKLKC
ncbi:Asx homology domain-containing protein [Pilobolus umbonatus]|nr:Asx homology domain-containing protein [Pilobolus umbonatus]